MCFEWKNKFACGHIGFKMVERCPFLGMGCFGPNGTEKFVDVDDLCYDCKARCSDPNPNGRVHDPYRQKGEDSAGGK